MSNHPLPKQSFIQGPLAGVSTTPFRELVWQYSQPTFVSTEMISCKTILHDPQFIQQRFINKSPLEKKLSVQLSSHEPAELAQATKIVTDMGADLIDLNCGCPKKKIRSKNTGSKLLSDPQKLYYLIRAMKDNTHVPVSIKIRVDSQSDDNFNAQIATVVADAGADFLVVHGRHWTQGYETPCSYDDIAFFVSALAIPVIGNGDVACKASLDKMLATGCAGVMIGRAGVGQPWLIAQLQAALLNQPFSKPHSKQIAEIFLLHTKRLINLLGSERFAVFHARKLAKYYARDIFNKTEFCDAVNNCESFSTLKSLCTQYF